MAMPGKKLACKKINTMGGNRLELFSKVSSATERTKLFITLTVFGAAHTLPLLSDRLVGMGYAIKHFKGFSHDSILVVALMLNNISQ
jgi:hypothetical protein